MRFKYCLNLFGLAVVLSMVTGNANAGVPGDFDANGSSDLSAAKVNRAANTTEWEVRFSPIGNKKGYIFPVAADAFVTGAYYRNDPKVYPGVVHVDDINAPLRWVVKDAADNNVTFYFGKPGDTVPNQGDMDCDGITDPIVARNGVPGFYDGFKLWYVALSSNPGYVQQLLFGLAGDRIGTADMNGDGCSELVVLRDNYTWYSRRLFGDAVTAVQWGLPGDTPLLPQDFDNDGTAQYVVTRNFGNQMYGLLRQEDGQVQINPLGSTTSIPLLGRFIGANWYAWYERATSFMGVAQYDGSVAVFNFGQTNNHIIRPDGTVIAPIAEEPASSVVSASSNSSNNDGSPSCDSQIKRNDGSGGFKNNPKNSRGTLKVMFPKTFTGNIRNVYAYDGDRRIDTLDEGATLEWGDRERYYGNMSLRSYPKPTIVQVVTRTGRTHCVTLDNPSAVYD